MPPSFTAVRAALPGRVSLSRGEPDVRWPVAGGQLQRVLSFAQAAGSDIDDVHVVDLPGPLRNRFGLLGIGVQFLLWRLGAAEEMSFLEWDASVPGTLPRRRRPWRGWWPFDLL